MDFKYLEGMTLLRRAMSAFAKDFNATTEQARQLLKENSNGSLDSWLASINDQETRRQVNVWWRKYKSQLSKWNLGPLRKIPRPSKLEPPAYEQVMCFVWLTHRFTGQEISVKPIEKKMEPKPTWRQQLVQWCQRLFHR